MAEKKKKKAKSSWGVVEEGAAAMGRIGGKKGGAAAWMKIGDPRTAAGRLARSKYARMMVMARINKTKGKD